MRLMQTGNETIQPSYELSGLADIPWLEVIVRGSGAFLSGYHGAKRHGSMGWGALWGTLGFLFPMATVAFAMGQGFAKRPCLTREQ